MTDDKPVISAERVRDPEADVPHGECGHAWSSGSGKNAHRCYQPSSHTMVHVCSYCGETTPIE